MTERVISTGLKEVLKVCTVRVIIQVGKSDGYLNDKAIYISLPANLQKVHTTLESLGL